MIDQLRALSTTGRLSVMSAKLSRLFVEKSSWGWRGISIGWVIGPDFRVARRDCRSAAVADSVVIQRDELVQAFRARGYQLWVSRWGIARRAARRDDKRCRLRDRCDADEVEGLVADWNDAFDSRKAIRDDRHPGGRSDAEQWSEITTFRGDAYSEGSRLAGGSIRAEIHGDLARRDFTINAMARDALTGAAAGPV
jgi:poly(A) polymerase